VVAGGSHTGAVIVVDGAERVRTALEAVYAALELEWDPRTVGAVDEEIGAGAAARDETPHGAGALDETPHGAAARDETAHRAAAPSAPLWDAVRDALLAEYAARYELVPGELDPETLALARRLAVEHRPPAQAA
jgi:hypothetical protein